MTVGIDLAKLIETHQSGVWRYLRLLGCDPAQADDLTQETFLAVFQKPPAADHPAATDPTVMGGYLRTAARNLFISWLRKNRRLTSLESFDEIDAQWSRWAKHDNGDAFLDALTLCLETLTDRAQSALRLRYRDDRSRSEIAGALDLTEDGAKNLLQRSKQQLRACIERRLG